MLETNDPKLRSWVEVDPDSDFSIQNLPYVRGENRTHWAGTEVISYESYAVNEFDLAELCFSNMKGDHTHLTAHYGDRSKAFFI